MPVVTYEPFMVFPPLFPVSVKVEAVMLVVEVVVPAVTVTLLLFVLMLPERITLLFVLTAEKGPLVNILLLTCTVPLVELKATEEGF